jgi:SAM-dependent methyltransferase
LHSEPSALGVRAREIIVINAVRDGTAEFRASDASEEQRVVGLEARVAELAGLATLNPKINATLATIDSILSQLVQRLLALEARLGSLERAEATNGERPEGTRPEEVDAALRNLSARVLDGKPQLTYLNQRFRDYETLVRNLKSLASQRDTEFQTRHAPVQASGPRFVPLKAKGCTEEDMHSDWVAFWCQELRKPVSYHRKCWELCYVPQILYNEGKLREGCRGLGFACGEEPLPSLFAKYGARVLATDLEPSRAESQAWRESNQHLGKFEKLRCPQICADEARLAAIEGAYVDMNAIPEHLYGQFDFCWSICSLEHLGSIANGLDFIENSLLTLKPGGVSVHTMEYNIHDGETVDRWPTVLFQKKHLLQLADRLRAKNCVVYDFDFDPGRGILDGFVDLPPFFDPNNPALNSHAHLKLSLDGFVCTSFGFIVKKPDENL